MSAHFGGSAAACDRRRRRLVQDSLQGSTLPVGGRSPRGSRGQSNETAEPAETAVTPRRRWKLVPQSTRVLGILCFLNVLAWGVMLWLGCSQWAANRGLQQYTSIPDGPLIRAFSIFQLLLTANLSFLIYWYRSRSRKDFMGRYRLWSWAGLFWSMVCLGMFSQAEFGFVRPLLRRLELDSWRPETMAWLLPLAIGVVAVYRVLRRELRQSKLSLATWETSFSLGVLAAALNLGLDNFLPASIRETCTAAVWSLWHVSLAISCLVHLRFVVHITNEAAPRQPSRGTRVLKWSHQHLTQVGERVATSRPRLRRLRIDTPVAGDHPAIKPPRTRQKKKLAEGAQQPEQGSEPTPSASTGTHQETATDTATATADGKSWSKWNPFRKKSAADSTAEAAAQAAAVGTPVAGVPAPHFSLSRLAKRMKANGEAAGVAAGTLGTESTSSTVDAEQTSEPSKGWLSRWKKSASAERPEGSPTAEAKDLPRKEAKPAVVAPANKAGADVAAISETQAERKGWWSRWKKSADAKPAADTANNASAEKTKEQPAKEAKAVATPSQKPEANAETDGESHAERKGWWSRWKKSADAETSADTANSASAVKAKEQPAKEAKAVATPSKKPEANAESDCESQAERKGWWSRWKKSAVAEPAADTANSASAVEAKEQPAKEAKAVATPSKKPEANAESDGESQAERKGWWSRWKKSADAEPSADGAVAKSKEKPPQEAKPASVAPTPKKVPEQAAEGDVKTERKGWWSRSKKSAEDQVAATEKPSAPAKAEAPQQSTPPARPAPPAAAKVTPPAKKPDPTPAAASETENPAGKSWSFGWGSKKSAAEEAPAESTKPAAEKPAPAKPIAEKPAAEKPVVKAEPPKAPASAPTMAARPSPPPTPAPKPAPAPSPPPPPAPVARAPVDDDERDEVRRPEKARKKPEPMEMEPEDEDDYDYSDMSAKERKRLKKRARQQGRGDRD